MCISNTFSWKIILVGKKRMFFPSYVYFISCSRMQMESTPVTRGVKDFASFFPLKHHRAALTVTLSEILQNTVVHTWSPKLECKSLGCWAVSCFFTLFCLKDSNWVWRLQQSVAEWVGHAVLETIFFAPLIYSFLWNTWICLDNILKGPRMYLYFKHTGFCMKINTNICKLKI